MKNTKSTLEILKKWIDVIHNSIYVFAVIEALLVIIIGVASSNIYNETHSSFWLYILIILAIVYSTITVVKIAYNKSFPLSIIEELQAKSNLESAENLILRKDAINSYISNTLLDLHKCKCEIPRQLKGKDWSIDSDQDFHNGLTSITATFNRTLNVLLNSSDVSFTTGVFVSYFRGFDHKIEATENKGLFMLRDDFDLGKTGRIKSMISDNNLSGLELEMQNMIKVSLNNGKFLFKDLIQNGDEVATMICINIQDLEDRNYQQGVLFILSKPFKKLPEDLESVLRIFSNIISHWFDLYEHKVLSRQLDIIAEQ